MGARPFEVLAHGYSLVEGPSVGPGGNVFFSDVMGGVYRWADGEGVDTVVPNRRGVGGIAVHADGGLLVTGRQLLHVREDGSQQVVLSSDEAKGFNDLGTDARGRVYVGALHFNVIGGEPPVPGAIWRVDEGCAAELTCEIDWPNGIAVSPDGRTLYACDYQHSYVLAFDLSESGELFNQRVFARSPASADGIAVDADGFVWVALGAGGAVGRFDPGEGLLVETFDVPATFVASLCFGGSDMQDLLVTTADNTDDPSIGGCLLRTRVDVPGLPVHAARV
jgi:gluconolactonase